VTIEELSNRGKSELVRVIFPLGRRHSKKVREGIAPLLGAFGNAVLLPQTYQMLVIERAGGSCATSSRSSSRSVSRSPSRIPAHALLAWRLAGLVEKAG
jgi:hypothetical protein